MTTRHGAAVLLLGLSLLLATGCLRRTTPSIEYYMLSVPRPAETLGVATRVAGFTAEPAYSSTRIAYRTSPYRLGYHTFHRWAANPQSLVASAVDDYFANERTSNVPIYLTGRIRRLEAVDIGGDAHASLELSLEAHRGSERIFTRTYREDIALEEHDPEHVAAALSVALGRVLERFADDLATRLGNHRP